MNNHNHHDWRGQKDIKIDAGLEARRDHNDAYDRNFKWCWCYSRKICQTSHLKIKQNSTICFIDQMKFIKDLAWKLLCGIVSLTGILSVISKNQPLSIPAFSSSSLIVTLYARNRMKSSLSISYDLEIFFIFWNGSIKYLSWRRNRKWNVSEMRKRHRDEDTMWKKT